ncbi:MAG: SusD/RagB family nutrient-binding outer membrane lipoprotein [Saprospiraceae bacterium]
MKNIAKFISLGVVFFLSSCSLTDLEGNLDNPNEVGLAALDANLLNNKIQADFGEFFQLANDPALDLCRMTAMIGGDVYERGFDPQDHNDMWERAYQDVLISIQTLHTKTDGNANLAIYSGTTRVLKAYVLLTLVDLYGDVPYSQALKGGSGAANFNPGTDTGRSIYDAAIAMLDEADGLLATATIPTGFRDIYYPGTAAVSVPKWRALANTLKLKAYMNLRLTDNTAAGKIADLLTKDLIDTNAEEFTYKYSAASTPARARHPLYRQMYGTATGEVSGYINNQYMNICYKQKGVEDPRWRYYFYRQVGSINKALSDEPESIPCIISPYPAHYPAGMAFCAFDPGFFGREHGNADGIPPDGRALTCFGVYPAGGRPDLNNGDANYHGMTVQGQGASGAGIEPIWMASFTEFLKAEALLVANLDASAMIASGIAKSIDRVKAFGVEKGQVVPANLIASDSAYQLAVATAYAGGSTDDKWNVYAKEFYIALWGNGIEGYNLYRRTQKPGTQDMQPMRGATPGKYQYTLVYPSDFVNLNSSTAQKVPTAVNKVFWDNNGDNISF